MLGIGAPRPDPRPYPAGDREAVVAHLRALLPDAWIVELERSGIGVYLQPTGAATPICGGYVFRRGEFGRGWHRREAVRLWALCVGMAGVAACEVRRG